MQQLTLEQRELVDAATVECATKLRRFNESRRLFDGPLMILFSVCAVSFVISGLFCALTGLYDLHFLLAMSLFIAIYSVLMLYEPLRTGSMIYTSPALAGLVAALHYQREHNASRMDTEGFKCGIAKAVTVLDMKGPDAVAALASSMLDVLLMERKMT